MAFENAGGLSISFGFDCLSTHADTQVLGRVKEKSAKKRICDPVQLVTEPEPLRF